MIIFVKRKITMISRNRMKIDVLGQSLLVGALLLLFFFQSGSGWTTAMLVLLIIWQIASAMHLYLTYRYIERINFVKTFIVLLVSLPVWIQLIGSVAYLAVIGVVFWSFFWSIRDMIKVNNRPRSFWDL